MNTDEYKLHVACIDYIRGQVRHGNKTYPVTRPFPALYSPEGKQRFTHIYQGRNEDEGFHLKQMGLRPGISDLMLWPGFLGFIDFKVHTELSRDQAQFFRDVGLIGAKTATATSREEFRDTLISWGLECINPTIQPPKPTRAQIDQGLMEMHRR